MCVIIVFCHTMMTDKPLYIICILFNYHKLCFQYSKYDLAHIDVLIVDNYVQNTVYGMHMAMS